MHYQKQKFQYQLTEKDKRWHSWVLFFLCAKCFHLFKTRTATRHGTLCAQGARTPAARSGSATTSSQSGQSGGRNLSTGALVSLVIFLVVFCFVLLLPLCCWICLLNCSKKKKLNADFWDSRSGTNNSLIRLWAQRTRPKELVLQRIQPGEERE